MILEQRLSLITLGSADIARAKAFYKDVLGWTPFMETPEIAFFNLGGFVLGVWTHEGLRADMKRNVQTAPDAYRGFALAHNARTLEEVDVIFARLKEKGATILKPPEKTEWGGYSGYFADPDGHPWEVAFNIGWPVAADGRLQIPEPDA